MPAEHIVRSYDQELDKLRRTIAQMGGLAESQLEAAIRCVASRDADLASEVVKNDAALDQYEQDVDALTVRLFALRQPMASDLREVLTSLKIAADLERIGDYAANVAKRSIVLAQTAPVKPAGGIPRLGRLVQEILKEVLDAYSRRDVAAAMAVWSRDEEVDDLYTSLFRETLTYMMEDPRTITPCTHLLFMAKNIERIGDHATNIAEDVYFLVEGRPLRSARPKGDASSFAVVTPGSRTEDDGR